MIGTPHPACGHLLPIGCGEGMCRNGLGRGESFPKRAAARGPGDRVKRCRGKWTTERKLLTQQNPFSAGKIEAKALIQFIQNAFC
jgi:hypothetical protein